MRKTVLPALLLMAAAAGPARSQQALIELEDLIITAPMDKLPRGTVLDPQLTQHLLRLLQQRADARPDTEESLDASVGNLIRLATATGYKLKTRYTELGFLLTEGLAGTRDFQLANELERVAKLGQNVQTRAAAMVALAYTRDMRYLNLFQGALIDMNTTVRFGAVESLLLLDNPAVKFLVANVARDDRSVPLRLYAAAGLWRMGDPYGKDVLLRYYQDRDWLTRGLAARYLGELGGAEEYRKLMQQLASEQHPSVKVELCSALLRLQKFKDN